MADEDRKRFDQEMNEYMKFIEIYEEQEGRGIFVPFPSTDFAESLSVPLPKTITAYNHFVRQEGDYRSSSILGSGSHLE